ncbi:MAG: M20/M25/M40 family metallo-hydrolase, partial [Betaproteobacteria bacterium]
MTSTSASTPPYTRIEHLRPHEDELTRIRKYLHQHPELAFEEHKTSGFIAKKLQDWGFEVTRGIGGTGLVGTLRNGTGPKRLGIRADMDALPIHECTGVAHASTIAGRMHACGHDGHMA